MGVTSEVDLLLNETIERQEMAMTKKSKGLIDYTQTLGEVKKEKQEKYLTIQGLLNHPYFIAINEAETTIIIEEFERLIEQQ